MIADDRIKSAREQGSAGTGAEAGCVAAADMIEQSISDSNGGEEQTGKGMSRPAAAREILAEHVAPMRPDACRAVRCGSAVHDMRPGRKGRPVQKGLCAQGLTC